MARELARRLGATHIELDELLWLPDWRKREPDEVQRLLEEPLRATSWVVCGNLRAARDVVWTRADTVIVLDLPRRVVMKRVIVRTLRRIVRRERLWAGNRETLRNVLALHDPERSIIAWSWTHHRTYSTEYREVATSQMWPQLRFIFCSRTAEVARLLASDEVNASPLA